MNKFPFTIRRKGLIAMISSGIAAVILLVSMITAQANPSVISPFYTGQAAQINDAATPLPTLDPTQRALNRDESDFLRTVQELNIAFGSVSRAEFTQNGEPNYLKSLVRGGFSTPLTQSAFDAFNAAAGAASGKCYAAQVVVLSHTGFDENGMVTTQADATTTVSTADADIAACQSAYQAAFANLVSNLSTSYSAQKLIPQFSIPTEGNGGQVFSLPLTQQKVQLIEGLGTTKVQDLTAGFHREQQIERKMEGYITLANNTLNGENAYLKQIERAGVDLSQVQAAFAAFGTNVTASEKVCGPAFTVVDTHTGFDNNNVVTSQSDAKSTLSSAVSGLGSCHDSLLATFNAFDAAFATAQSQVKNLPAYSAPSIN